MVATTLCTSCFDVSWRRFTVMKRFARFLERIGFSNGTVNRVFSWLVRVLP
jgi:hypothetical protein